MKKYLLTILLLFVISCLCYPIGYFLFDKNSNIVILDNKNYVHNSVIAYIINLDRSPERLEFVKTNVEKLNIPFERISAVDGNLITKEELQQKVSSFLKSFDSRNKLGVFGCYLSHLKT